MKMNLVLCLSVLLSLSSCSDKEMNSDGGNGEPSVVIENVNIIPLPQFLSYGSSAIGLTKNIAINYSDALAYEANQLVKFLEEDHNMTPVLAKGKVDADVDLILDPNMVSKAEGAYKLEIANRQIKLTSQSALGIFYGLQTIRQIIIPIGNAFSVRELTVSDYPNTTWREVMLDEGRYFKGKKAVKNILDEMARLKMNIFHWHLTEDLGWRLEIKKYPRLIEIGSKRDSTQINDGPDWSWVHNKWDGKPHSGHYTQTEVKEVIEYANNLHITIVPEIEILTHASAAIASYPWLGTTGKQIKVPCDLGVLHEVINIANPNAMTFIHDVLDEVSELFPGEYIHVGGDEMQGNNWKNSPDIQKMKASLNIETNSDLQIYFFNNISKYLESKGKKMMGWSDIIGQWNITPKIKIDMAPGTISQFWVGDYHTAEYALKNGLLVVQSHTNFAYFNNWLPKIYELDHYYWTGNNATLKKNIIGIGAECWGEFDSTVEKMYDHMFPRIAAYAELGWTKPELKEYKNFLARLAPLYNVWEKKGISVGGTEESKGL